MMSSWNPKERQLLADQTSQRVFGEAMDKIDDYVQKKTDRESDDILIDLQPDAVDKIVNRGYTDAVHHFERRTRLRWREGGSENHQQYLDRLASERDYIRNRLAEVIEEAQKGAKIANENAIKLALNYVTMAIEKITRPEKIDLVMDGDTFDQHLEDIEAKALQIFELAEKSSKCGGAQFRTSFQEKLQSAIRAKIQHADLARKKKEDNYKAAIKEGTEYYQEKMLQAVQSKSLVARLTMDWIPDGVTSFELIQAHEESMKMAKQDFKRHGFPECVTMLLEKSIETCFTEKIEYQNEDREIKGSSRRRKCVYFAYTVGLAVFVTCNGLSYAAVLAVKVPLIAVNRDEIVKFVKQISVMGTEIISYVTETVGMVWSKVQEQISEYISVNILDWAKLLIKKLGLSLGDLHLD